MKLSLLSGGFAILAAALTYAVPAGAEGPARVPGRHVDGRGRVLKQFCPAEAHGPSRFRCFGYRIQGDGADDQPDKGCSAANGQSTTVLPGTMGVPEIQQAYGLANAPTSGGAVVAVVDLYGYTKALTELNVYRTQYGLSALPLCTGTVPTVGGPPCFANIDQNGKTSRLSDDPQGAEGWDGEAALDLQMVSAACPDCSIVLVSVSANTQSDDPFSPAVAKVASLIPGLSAISNSYGGPEQGGDDDSAYNQKGVLVLAASGDQDYMDEGFSEQDSSNVFAANFPASSPHVLSVGGTTPSPDSTSARGFSEVVWNLGIDPETHLPAGGGSGCSIEFEQPNWQSNIHDPSCTRRASVDVSAAADYDSKTKSAQGQEQGGISIYAGGCWTAVGGTSAATPLTAAILSRFKVATQVANDFSLLYKNLTAFNDVTEGTNDPLKKCTDINCTAGVGWDGPTGLGTPNGGALCVLGGACAAPDAGADGGTPTSDAGGGGDDGGSTSADAGHGTNGDGGSSTEDSGAGDPGNGDGPGGGNGGGGCAASPAPAETGFGAMGVMVGLAALFARRRRR